MGTTPSEEMLAYAKQHLISHMFDAGMSKEAIEASIMTIPADHENRGWVVDQYIAALPPEERDAARERLSV